MQRKIIYIHACIVLPLNLIIAFIALNISFSSSLVIELLSLFFILNIFWLYLSSKITFNSMLNPYIIFITATIIFNGGQIILQGFGFNSQPMLQGIFNNDILIKTIVLVTLSLVFIHLGALISGKSTRNKKNLEFNIHDKAIFKIRVVGWLLIIISIVPTLLIFKQTISLVNEVGYLGLYNQIQSGSITKILSAFLVPGIILLLVTSKNSLYLRFFCIGALLATTILYFYIGSRSSAILPLIAGVWAYDKTVKRIPRLYVLVAGILTLIFVFPLVAAYRDTGERTLYLIVEALKNLENPFISILQEMGESMKTIAYTIELIPMKREFDWGIGYFYSLLIIFPNLFWEVHPSIEHGLYASWLVWEVDPSFASIGGGLGYSFIAEAYANFSWIAPVILTIFGLLMGWSIRWSANSILKTAMIASFMSFVLLLSRGETASFVRALFWYALIPYLLVIILHHIKLSFKK